MGFLSPKQPKPAPPPANAPTSPFGSESGDREAQPFGISSLISTSSQGLKRRANTQRTSLIGGG